MDAAVPRAAAHITLRALIYAILFQRNMEAVEPQTFDALDAAVVCAPNEALDKEIRAKLEEFSLEYLEPRAPRGELAVVFLQKRPRKGWFATTEELIPWELHLITLTFTPSPNDPHTSTARHPSLGTAQASTGTARDAQKAPSLVPALTQILMFCADKRHAVPPLGGADSALSHQIMINPPTPTDLFSPSPSPPLPARSPPPVPSTTIATATFQARDTAAAAGSSAAHELREARGGDRGDQGRERHDRVDREGRDRVERDRVDRVDKAVSRPGQGQGYERRGSGFTGTSAPSPYAGGGESSRPGQGHGTGYTNPLRGYGYTHTSTSDTNPSSAQAMAQGRPRGYEHTDRERDREANDSAAATDHHNHGQAHGQGGYLDAAKDGLRAVRAGAGAVAHWAGRGR